MPVPALATEPEPLIAPEMAAAAFPLVSSVAVTPLLMTTFRLAASDTLFAPNWSVLLLVKMMFVAGEAGAVPAASALMFNVPPLIVVPPIYELEAERTSVPVPVLVKEPLAACLRCRSWWRYCRPP